MRITGLEPARLLTIDPKSIASASSAISADKQMQPAGRKDCLSELLPHETSGVRTRDT